MTRSGPTQPSALVFAPYLAAAGGGERVMVAVAQHLADSHDVVIAAPRLPDPQRWSARGFPDLEIRVMNARRASWSSRRVDLFVTQANTVPLPSFAPRSLLVVQFPFDELATMHVVRRSAARASLRRFTVATYSEYCRRHVESRWGCRGVELLAPPVEQYPYRPDEKEELIVSVGRFSDRGHAKRQDALLEAWATVAERLPTWRLQLLGGGQRGDSYVEEILARAEELPRVEVVLDASPETLERAYRRASIYWHATGFGGGDDHPERAEHFGIAPVEAMSAGVVPVVFDAGGPAEVVSATTGRTWSSLDELVDVTEELARDRELRSEVQQAAHHDAQRFGRAAFERQLDALVTTRTATLGARSGARSRLRT